MSCTSILRALGLLGVAFVLVSAFTSLPDMLARWTGTSPRLERADAIVVLASQIEADGALSHHSLRRAVHGIILQRRGFAPLLVFSGATREGTPGEAQIRAALARELGVPAEIILADTGARTTREEATRMTSLLGTRGVRSILLVTDAQHMARAGQLFARAGFEVLPAPVDDPEHHTLLMRRILEEFLARLYYRVNGYL